MISDNLDVALSPAQRRRMEGLFGRWRSFRAESDHNELHAWEQQKSTTLRLTNAYRSAGLHLFDPYLHCGVRPLERYTRDFIAAAFIHPDLQAVGETLFSLLLDEGAVARSGMHEAEIASLREAWDGECPSCEIEVAMMEARPDVVLTGDNFLVAIEIKRRMGVETIVGGKTQTHRLKQAIVEQAKARDIPQSSALAFFMTPDGANPAEPSVIPINTTRLFEHLSRALNADLKLSPKSKRLMTSFMDLIAEG